MKITDEMLSAAAPKARDLLLDSLPADPPSHDASPEFRKKMEKLHRAYRWKRRGKTALRCLRKTAVVVFIVLGVASAGVLTVAAVQGSFMDLIVHIYETYITYEVKPTASQDYEYKELYDIHLEYLPSDMNVAFKLQTASDYQITIRREARRLEDVRFVQVYQRIITPGERFFTAFEIGDAQPIDFAFSGFNAQIYEKEDQTYIRWFDHNIYYELIGDIGTEELKKIAENIIFYN